MTVYVSPVEVRYSGSGSASNPDASRGGAMSANMVQSGSYTASGGIPGVSILEVYGDVGTHTIDFRASDKTIALDAAPFVRVDISANGIYKIPGSAGPVVQVVSANLPAVDTSITYTVAKAANQLFSDVSTANKLTGWTSYRCVYLYNAGPNQVALALTLTGKGNGGAEVQWTVDAVNSVPALGAVDGVTVSPIPSSNFFSTAVLNPTLNPGDSVPLWLQWHESNSSVGHADDVLSFTIGVTDMVTANGDSQAVFLRRDVHPAAFVLNVSEALTLHGANVNANALVTNVAEHLNLHDTSVIQRNVLIAYSETLDLHDAATTRQAMIVGVSESLILGEEYRVSGDMLAFVVNYKTQSVTQYSNYNFNSFAKFGRDYYGAADDGLYLLDGDNDNGVPIDADLVLGKLDFDSSLLKRLPVMYLGIHTSGAMILRVTADTGETRDYLMDQTVDTLRTGRLELGRGVASRYWQFELKNVTGSDFTLDSMEFYPVTLTRRITER